MLGADSILMASLLTLENRLLLACARTAPDVTHVRELVGRGPDWQDILRKTERSSLAPLVYANLRQAVQSGHVPKLVGERLRDLYRRDTVHGIARRELLRATLLRFAEANIPVIVLKGAALATLVYLSPGLRPMRDIDLLVHRRDLDRVAAVLRSLKNPPPGFPSLGPENLSLLDIRHSIFNPSSAEGMGAAAGIPIEEFWERARSAQIESVATLVLSHEDLLLHLAFDLADAGGSIRHVHTLCDIGEICQRLGDVVDWRQLVTRARVYELGKPLYHALRLARELAGASVPSSALKELQASFRQLPLERQFIAVVARRAILFDDQDTHSPSKFYKLGMRLLLAHQRRDGVTVAYRHLARAWRARLRRLVAYSGPRPPYGAGSREHDSSWQEQQTMAHLVFQGEHSIRTHGEVAVTYDQNASDDGVGAQLQRIYGLYALSRALDIKYVHTPLGQVNYQGLMPLLAGRSDPDFTTRYNAFFSLPSDDFDLDDCERVHVSSMGKKQVEYYRQYAEATGRPVLLQTLEPYGYTDRHPEAYLALRAVSPYREFRPKGPIRICIHVRRGDAVIGRDPRLLPNAYFLRVCETVVNALQQQRASFVVRLHTEIPQRPYTLYPGLAGLDVHLHEPSRIDPVAHALEDFEALPNLEKVLNVEPREALDDFATADVLILSLSCLGYVGGLLNPHGLVIAGPNLPPPQNFHTALPDWLVANEYGNVDAVEVASRIAVLLRCRG